MKKRTLRIEALTVQSFVTSGTEGRMGAAEARALFATRPQVCDPFTLPPRCA